MNYQKECKTLEMSNSNKVSIIMPAFNASKSIDDSIESVLNQTWKDWELIVINDCSTDNTMDIVMKYAACDDRIILQNNLSNMGVALARNEGLKRATGKYIAFLDSDDLWAPNKLEKQLHFMEANRYAFTFTSYQKFNSMTGKKGKVIKAPAKMDSTDVLRNTVIGCLTVMVNKEMVGNFYMPNLDHMEDNSTWYTILNKGLSAYGIPEVLAFYRVGNNSLTVSKGKSAKQQWYVYRSYYHYSVIKSMYCFLNYAVNAFRRCI